MGESFMRGYSEMEESELATNSMHWVSNSNSNNNNSNSNTNSNNVNYNTTTTSNNNTTTRSNNTTTSNNNNNPNNYSPYTQPQPASPQTNLNKQHLTIIIELVHRLNNLTIDLTKSNKAVGTQKVTFRAIELEADQVGWTVIGEEWTVGEGVVEGE
jgi:hypothetical protein